MSIITFKRGDTLKILGIKLVDQNNDPILLDDYVIECQARTKTDKVALNFSVVKYDYSFDLVVLDTSSCPVGDLYADIQYTRTLPSGDNEIVSSGDFIISCRVDRTRP